MIQQKIHFHIQINKQCFDLSIQIYDLQGRLITYKAIKANTYQEIYDLEKFNAGNGIYFINLITGKDRKTLKLIKIE